jgi:Skp family chaperone for outer membrane proteins
MKTFSKTLLAASALALSPLALSAPASAQVAYSDPQAVLAQSQAWKTAQSQIQTTYKAQIDAFESRSKVLQAELNAMAVRFEADQKANPNNPSLPGQAKAIQDKQAAAQQELGRLSDGFERARAYALEQIDTKLDQAFTQAMTKKRIQLVIQRQAVLKPAPGTDLTPDILAELNALIPAVGIVPPAGWQPGGQQQRPAVPGAQTPPKPSAPGR